MEASGKYLPGKPVSSAAGILCKVFPFGSLPPVEKNNSQKYLPDSTLSRGIPLKKSSVRMSAKPSKENRLEFVMLTAVTAEVRGPQGKEPKGTESPHWGSPPFLPSRSAYSLFCLPATLEGPVALF